MTVLPSGDASVGEPVPSVIFLPSQSNIRSGVVPRCETGQGHLQELIAPHDLMSTIGDPRVETLPSWARSGGQLTDRETASLAALEQRLRAPRRRRRSLTSCLPAYARVPNRGSRDLRADNRMVGVAKLGEAGHGSWCAWMRSHTGTRGGRSTKFEVACTR